MVISSVLSRFCFELEAKAIDTGAVWSQCEVGQGGLRKACRNSLQFEVLSDFTFSRSVPSLWTAVTWNRSSPCFLSGFVQSQP